MDERWEAVKVANNWRDNGGRRPTGREFGQIYSLAYGIWNSWEISYTELGEIMCRWTDIDVARSRVWNWVQRGKAGNLTNRRNRPS